MTKPQFRLVTRSDFDGLVCGVLLKELNLIDEITFVHPKDMQDGKTHKKPPCIGEADQCGKFGRLGRLLCPVVAS
jgi:hypothetical protein